jgi:uncharacterized protein involved in exopolysaccharide biosynthesis
VQTSQPQSEIRSNLDDRDEMKAAGKPITIISILNVFLRHKLVLMGIPALALVLMTVSTLLKPAEYVADSTFMPQGGVGAASRVSGLAAQLGVAIAGGASESLSLQFYADLITSRELLREVATTAFTFQSAADGVRRSGTLIDLYEPDGQTPEGRVRQVLGMLNQTVSATADPVIGVVNVTVRAPWPELAVLINRHLLDLVNDFNLRRRQSQARAEREFTQSSFAKAERDLAAAEQELQRFLQQNRQFQQSPQLSFERVRLQRKVDQLQQITSTLATSFAQSQIAEVRNTPVVTVIDQPEHSAKRVPRSLLTAGIIALIFGFFAAALLALAMDYYAAQKEANPDEFAEFQRLRRAALSRFGRGAQRRTSARAFTD